jgi:hypothetical protein
MNGCIVGTVITIADIQAPQKLYRKYEVWEVGKGGAHSSRIRGYDSFMPNLFIWYCTWLSTRAHNYPPRSDMAQGYGKASILSWTDE